MQEKGNHNNKDNLQLSIVNCQLFALLLLLVLAQGCARDRETTLVSFFKETTLDTSALRRVVVVPFSFPGGETTVIDETTNAFALELQKTGGFEVVVLTNRAERLAKEANLWYKGTVSMEAIIEARKQHRADAFVFGTITHYKPFEPPVLGLKVQMISAKNGAVTWAADGVFDSNEITVLKRVMDYYNQTYGKKELQYGWKIMMISMRHYAHYVAREIVSTLAT